MGITVIYPGTFDPITHGHTDIVGRAAPLFFGTPARAGEYRQFAESLSAAAAGNGITRVALGTFGAASGSVEEEARFASESLRRDETDGLSLEFAQWRFNLRSSNTEPVLRLNVESRGDKALMEEKTREILEVVDGMD